MATLRSAKKRIRQNIKRRARNRVFRGRARTNVRIALAAIDEGNLEEAREVTMQAVSSLDKAASKGVLHKNNASRRKGRLMKKLAALESPKK